MTRKLVLLAALVASAGFATTAVAATPQARGVTVNYADLDLESPAGIERLHARLDAAARSVCGSAPTRDLDALVDWRRCRADALENAVRAIDNAALTAHHAGTAAARFARNDAGSRG
jgi:UrcA family protein